MYYTQTYKANLRKNLKQIAEKRKQINQNLKEKQLKAQIQRKINQNKDVLQKIQLGRDIEQRRLTLLIGKKIKDLEFRKQLNMNHETNLDNINMFRRYKSKIQNKNYPELSSSKSMEKNKLQVSRYLAEKDQKQRQMLSTLRGKFMQLNKTQFSLKKLNKPFNSMRASMSPKGNNSSHRNKSHQNVQKSFSKNQEQQNNQQKINNISSKSKSVSLGLKSP